MPDWSWLDRVFLSGTGCVWLILSVSRLKKERKIAQRDCFKTNNMINENLLSVYLRLRRLLLMNSVAASSVLLPSITAGLTAVQLTLKPMDGGEDGERGSFSLLLIRSSLEFLSMLLTLSLIRSVA